MQRRTEQPGIGAVAVVCRWLGMKKAPFFTAMAFAICTLMTVQANGAQTGFAIAFQRGMVDLSADYWSRENFPALLDALKTLQPGIVNRFGFMYGGPPRQWLDHTAKIAAAIHDAVPNALLGAALPQSLHQNYNVVLNCGGAEQAFAAKDLVTDAVQGGDIHWIDMSRPASRAYYICLGETLIDAGFDLIHFEAPELTLAHARDRDDALRAYAAVIAALRASAGAAHRQVYFSGDIALANAIKIDAVYLPARLYHNAQFALKYRKKVERPGIGVGYSYVLSNRIIADSKAAMNSSAKIFFYIDNWDASQDDLRRLMELDADNRHYLLKESIRIARENGVGFVPPLEHCVGCMPSSFVGDKCEIRSDGRTEYSAIKCDDLEFIQ